MKQLKRIIIIVSTWKLHINHIYQNVKIAEFLVNWADNGNELLKCLVGPSDVCMSASTAITPHYPDGLHGHTTLGDKPGLAGKRDIGQEEDFRTGLYVSQRNRTIFLPLKEDILFRVLLNNNQKVFYDVSSWLI